MGNLGPMEILLIVGVALLLFGAGRIATIGKTLPDLDANAVRDISIALLVTGAFYWVVVSVMNHR